MSIKFAVANIEIMLFLKKSVYGILAFINL